MGRKLLEKRITYEGMTLSCYRSRKQPNMVAKVSWVNVQGKVRDVSRSQVMQELAGHIQKSGFYSNGDRKILKSSEHRSDVHFSKDHCH